jgi:hypothetical protein
MFSTHAMKHVQALEKAVADAFPNALKKIESIIKNVSKKTLSHHPFQLGNVGSKVQTHF